MAKSHRYVFDEQIGAGGMGRVFRGRLQGALGFEREVAIKTIHPSHVEKDRARFLNEARIAATIHHDNIVDILDVCEEDGVPFLVLEWVDGPSLKQIHELAEQNVPHGVVVRIILDVLEGLHYAHESKNLVHRDVTPANILVSEQGKAKLIDFGLAKAQGLGSNTPTGEILGTVLFMPPEQARSSLVDRRADVWSACAVMRLLLTGTFPYDAPSQMQRMYMLSLGQDPDPLPIDAPEWLDAICKRAMAVEPDERFPTCAAFSEALLAAGVAIAPHSEVAAYLRTLPWKVERKPPTPAVGVEAALAHAPPVAMRPPPKRRRALLVGGIALGVAVGLAMATREPAPPPAVFPPAASLPASPARDPARAPEPSASPAPESATPAPEPSAETPPSVRRPARPARPRTRPVPSFTDYGF